MKKLHFLYEMQLYMSGNVTDHHFLIRCIPMEDARQHAESFDCRIMPECKVYEIEDGFGNRGCSGTIRRAHDRFFVRAEGIVTVGREEIRERVKTDAGPHPMYGFPSKYTMPEEAVRRLFSERNAEKAGMEQVLDLMDLLSRRFSYAPGTTTVQTTAAAALQGGAGVCQDYAHILISLCRLAGIPARYVAGMLCGEGASHAWVEVWMEGGWIGVDPTHNCLVDDNYIQLTHGRDFADGTIDKGCFLGFTGQRQQIYVKVEEVL